MHSVVIKVFEAFWHIPLKRGHLGGTGLPVSEPVERSNHTNHMLSCGKEGGFDGKQSILLFWKAHNKATNLSDDFSSNV